MFNVILEKRKNLPVKIQIALLERETKMLLERAKTDPML